MYLRKYTPQTNKKYKKKQKKTKDIHEINDSQLTWAGMWILSSSLSFSGFCADTAWNVIFTMMSGRVRLYCLCLKYSESYEYIAAVSLSRPRPCDLSKRVRSDERARVWVPRRSPPLRCQSKGPRPQHLLFKCRLYYILYIRVDIILFTRVLFL